MKRTVIAAVVATVASYGAFAQDPAAPQPDSNAPAGAQPSPATPDAGATPAAKPEEGTAHPPENRMDQATPTMKAPDAAESQAGSTTTPAGTELKVTEEDAKSWIGKTIYSSDNKNLGEIGELVRGPDDKVTELHADIGGFLGIGETRVRVGGDKIKEVRDDRIVLNLTEQEAKALPVVEESSESK